VSETDPDFPLRDLLGFTIEQGQGSARASLAVDARHINPHGTVHGAVTFALVDTAMGSATMSVVGDGNWCTTIDIHTRDLAPAYRGLLTAEARVRKAGRRIVQLEAVVVDGDGRELVTATGAFAVIPAPQDPPVH
jgi:acyl-CoA thioesterase